MIRQPETTQNYKILSITAVITIIMIGVLSVMLNTDTIKKSSYTIMGTSYLAIQVALGVLSNRKLDLSECEIEVIDKEKPALVVFTFKNEQFGVLVETGKAINADAIKSFRANKNSNALSDIVPGADYLAIQAAMEPFKRHNPNLADYVIKAVRRGNPSVIILFTDKDRPVGTLGSVSKRPEFEVEIDSGTFKILRSNFLR
jgi:hypothetical protein